MSGEYIGEISDAPEFDGSAVYRRLIHKERRLAEIAAMREDHPDAECVQYVEIEGDSYVEALYF